MIRVTLTSEPKESWSTAKHIGAYTAVFAIMTVIVFGMLFLQGKTLIWEGDGMKQHLQALTYVGIWIRSAIESLLSGSGFSLPTYSFSMGYGQDIITTLSYYAIGDPLNIATIFVPAKYTYILFNVLAIVRMYLAGIAFTAYCKYMRIGRNQGILAGSIVYAFCLFALCAVARHPFFLNPMTYLPLVLIGIERMLQENKPGIFIISIAISAMSNFYFFYMVFMLMALYIIMRLAVVYGTNLKESLKAFAKLVGTGLIGVLISCAILVPTIIAFLSDTRSGAQAATEILYSSAHYKAFTFGLAGTADPGEWSFGGYGIISMLCIFSLFSRKGSAQLKIAFVVLTAMLLIPAAGLAMNGFAYASNRWIWGYSLLIGIIVAYSWGDIISLNLKRAAVLSVCCIAYLVVSFLCGMGIYATWQAGILCLFEALTAAAALILSNRGSNSPKRNGIAIITLICISICVNAACIYLPFAGGYGKELLDIDYSKNLLNNEASIVKSNAEQDDNDFWRYSGAYWIISPNNGLTAGVPSTDYYWSLSNASISQFMDELGVNTSEYETNRYRNLDDRTMLEEIASVKYHLALQSEFTPFGFDLNDKEKNQDARSWNIFENRYPLSFATLLYEQIPHSAYEKLSMTQKQQALMQGAVVDGDADLPEADLVDESTEVPFTFSSFDGVSLNENGTFTSSEKGSFTIAFNGQPNAETYLEITDLSYDGYREKHKFYVTFRSKSGDESQRSFKYSTQDYDRSSMRSNFLINSGYSEDSMQEAVVVLPAAGTYSMNLRIVCQGFNNYQEQAKAMASSQCENLDMGYSSNATAASNRVSFDAFARDKAVVKTAIPFSDGWRILVDGEEADVIRVDTMFAGVAIEKGEHQIVCEYRTPGLIPGSILSVAGLALFLALIILQRAKRHDVKPL